MPRLLVLAALVAPSVAAAQEAFDAHGFHLAPSDHDLADPLATWRPELHTRGQVGLIGLFEYAEAPLVLARPSSDGEFRYRTLLDDLFGINVGAHVGVHERVALTATVPVWFTSRGEGGVGGPALGDMRVHLPVTVFHRADDTGSVGVSVVPFVDAPTGASERYLGSQGLGGGAVVAGGWGSGPVHVAVNVGAQSRPSLSLENLQGGGQLIGGLAGSWRLAETVAVHAEAWLRPSLLPNRVPWTESPGEALLSGRGRLASGLAWNAGVAVPLTRGASAAAFRVFAGIGWRIGEEPPVDTDGDGLVDEVDACVEEPETFNGLADDDGCPDAVAALAVTVRTPEGEPAPGVEVYLDGDQVGRTGPEGAVEVGDLLAGESVVLEVRPPEAAPLELVESITVPLEEGLQRATVDLAWRPGSVRVVVRDTEGRPVDGQVTFDGPVDVDDRAVGDDGEEVFVLEPGDWTLLVSAPTFGTQRRDLAIEAGQRSLVVVEVDLEPAAVEVREQEVVLLEPVNFDFDSHEIDVASLPLLEEVANNLLTHPEIERVEIQGHTDSEGPADYNQRLSQRRMESVVEYLTGKGVDPARLDPVGYGESCPLATNDTDEGRARNRRVQFVITDPVPEEGLPCHGDNPARRIGPTAIPDE